MPRDLPTDALPEALTPLVPVRPTAMIFASLILGQIFNLAALSLLTAYLGLGAFGRYGICLLDFAIFSNLANFALPGASIPFLIRSRFRAAAYAQVMGARCWTTALAVTAYLLFESVFRRGSGTTAAFVLALAILLSPMQLEWWFMAKRRWLDLLAYRCIFGVVNLLTVYLWVRHHPGLPSAAASLTLASAAAFAYLALRSGTSVFALPKLRSPRIRFLLWRSTPLALAGVFDFLFIPLGFYAFRFFQGDGPLLGAYGTAYRLSLAASLFASSFFTVLLPRFSGGARRGDNDSVARLFDRMALALALPLFAVPLLAEFVLRTLFPGTDWGREPLAFGGWTLSCLALSFCLHLLRMAPLTKALAEGRSWSYCRWFFLAGSINLVAVGLGGWLHGARFLPVAALAADLAFTGRWCFSLYPNAPVKAAVRLATLCGAMSLYLSYAYWWIW
jgi:O-antigen/teichoic acid export membrane protein